MIRTYMTGSMLAVLLGFGADLIFGDPSTPLHPICLIGSLIANLEKFLRKIFPKTEKGELTGGILLWFLVILVSAGIPTLLLTVSYSICFWLGVTVEAVMCFFIFAVRSLKKESMNVGRALQTEGLDAGRNAVSRIVGRDTGSLSEAGVVKAAVETVAENFSDGVFAPMLYLMIGGGALGFFYKGINTMDSMVGYKNDKYLHFGRFAAKMDDAANFIPSRLAALFLIISAPLAGLDAKKAWEIWRRDRFCHASPNSAQTEAAAAGALHVRLAGDAWYFGKLCKKPFIGDDDRPVEIADIARMNRLMMAASVLSLVVMGVIRVGIILMIG